MPFARMAQGENAQSGKFPIASQPAAAHDQCIYDRRAHPGQFSEGAPEFSRRQVEYLGFRGVHARAGQSRRAPQHGDVADKVALACGGEDLFRAIARLENLDSHPARQSLGQDRGARPCKPVRHA